MRKEFVSSWSGGKDSCSAMFRAVNKGYTPKVVITAMNEDGRKTKSHGINSDLLELQIRSLGIASEKIFTVWNDYEEKFIEKLKFIKKKYEIDTAVFGDIDIEQHKEWEEKVCKEAGINASLPLWQGKRENILKQFLDTGFKAVIIAVNSEKLSNEFLGKELSYELIEGIKKAGSDACGENGEFHTVVIDGPLFSFPIKLKFGDIYSHSGYSFIETLIEDR